MIPLITVRLVQRIAITIGINAVVVGSSWRVVSSWIAARMVVAGSTVSRWRNFVLAMMTHKVIETHSTAVVGAWWTIASGIRFGARCFIVLKAVQVDDVMTRRWPREPFRLRLGIFLVTNLHTRVAIRFVCQRLVNGFIVWRFSLVGADAACRYVLRILRVSFAGARIPLGVSDLLLRWWAIFLISQGSNAHSRWAHCCRRRDVIEEISDESFKLGYDKVFCILGLLLIVWWYAIVLIVQELFLVAPRDSSVEVLIDRARAVVIWGERLEEVQRFQFSFWILPLWT